MNKAELKSKVDTYNNMVEKISVDTSSASSIQSEITSLQNSWNTDGATDVIGGMNNEVKSLENSLKTYEKCVNDIKNSKLQVSFEEVVEVVG